MLKRKESLNNLPVQQFINQSIDLIIKPNDPLRGLLAKGGIISEMYTFQFYKSSGPISTILSINKHNQVLLTSPNIALIFNPLPEKPEKAIMPLLHNQENNQYIPVSPYLIPHDKLTQLVNNIAYCALDRRLAPKNDIRQQAALEKICTILSYTLGLHNRSLSQEVKKSGQFRNSRRSF